MNPYEILGISADATEDEIKKAYHDIAKYNHPDLNHAGNDAFFEEQMKRINAANELAMNNLKVRKNIVIDENKLTEDELAEYSKIIETYNYIKNILGNIDEYHTMVGTNIFLDRVGEALKRYITRTERYLSYDVGNLGKQQYNELTDFLGSMERFSIKFKNYLVNTFTTAADEELFPVIKFIEPYTLCLGYLVGPWSRSLESVLVIINRFLLPFAIFSEIMYKINPLSKMLDNKDNSTTELAFEFYVKASGKVIENDEAVLEELRRSRAFDNFVVEYNKGKGRKLNFK